MEGPRAEEAYEKHRISLMSDAERFEGYQREVRALADRWRIEDRGSTKIVRDVRISDFASAHDPQRREVMRTDVQGLGIDVLRLELPVDETKKFLESIYARARPALRLTIEIVEASKPKERAL